MTDMTNRYCLITGATRGIGKATALGLARTGATVGIVARNPRVGAETCRDIQRLSGNSRIELFPCDLSSLSSVRSLAESVLYRWDELHVLVNVAGVFHTRRRTTVEGFEETFVVNYLSRFLLTTLLLDRLKVCAPARIVEVSGAYHARGRIVFDDLQLEHDYDGNVANSQAKLANVLFTVELARRLEGTGVTINCLHPGAVATDLVLSDPDFPAWQKWLYRTARPFLKSPEKGAETPLYLASSPEVAGVSGQYFVDRRAVLAAPITRDPELARRLWQASLDLICKGLSSRQGG